MAIASGDAGGITFCVATSNFYLFAITPGGSYHFDVVNGNGLALPGVLKQGSSSAIKRGFNQPNLIAFDAHLHYIHSCKDHCPFCRRSAVGVTVGPGVVVGDGLGVGLGLGLGVGLGLGEGLGVGSGVFVGVGDGLVVGVTPGAPGV